MLYWVFQLEFEKHEFCIVFRFSSGSVLVFGRAGARNPMIPTDCRKISHLISAELPRHLLLLSRGITESEEILRIAQDCQMTLIFSDSFKTETLDAAHTSDRRIL